jgi:hypothetical protein
MIKHRLAVSTLLEGRDTVLCTEACISDASRHRGRLEQLGSRWQAHDWRPEALHEQTRQLREMCCTTRLQRIESVAWTVFYAGCAQRRRIFLVVLRNRRKSGWRERVCVCVCVANIITNSHVCLDRRVHSPPAARRPGLDRLAHADGAGWRSSGSRPPPSTSRHPWTRRPGRSDEGASSSLLLW